MAQIAIMKVHRQDQYRDLARRLRKAGRGDLQRRLSREIRREGQGGLRAVQARFQTIDVRSQGPGGGKSTRLRARVANATRISILGSGIRYRVEPKKVHPVYGRALSFGLNGLGRWRYPVYGNTEVWRQNWGTEVFYKTLRGYEAAWRRGIDRAMDETERELLGG